MQIDAHGNTGVGWLPDGRLVSSDYDGHVATMNADGTNRNVAFERRFPISGISVCPDGVHTLFAMANKESNGLSIWSLNLQDGAAAPITKGKSDQAPVCSPDSKWFVYEALQTGKKILMRAPIGGGESKQVTDKFVEIATISPDGRQLAILTVEGTGAASKGIIQIIPSEGGAPVKTLPLPTNIAGLFSFSPDGQSLYYPILQRGIGNLVKQSLADGTVTPMTNFKDLSVYGFDFNWPQKKLATARGRSVTDVVLITQHAAPKE
jgi:Tol biopolymer transport system component